MPFTPLTNALPADAATFNQRLQQLQDQIDALSGGGGIDVVIPARCEARLSLASDDPVPQSDISGGSATTLYLIPFRGNTISVYNGLVWVSRTLGAQISIAMPSTTGTNYDVFVYDNSGSLAMELVAWTNSTTRATSLAYQSGILVKDGDPTRRYIGTVRTANASGQGEDSLLRRYVWNYYNRALRRMRANETADSWVYAGGWRPFNNSTANRAEVVIGVAEDVVEIHAATLSSGSAMGSRGTIGIGINSTSTNGADGMIPTAMSSAITPVHAWCRRYLGPGYAYIQMLEASTGGNNCTFIGDNGDAYHKAVLYTSLWG